jgi:hypothetical protein
VCVAPGTFGAEREAGLARIQPARERAIGGRGPAVHRRPGVGAPHARAAAPAAADASGRHRGTGWTGNGP